MELDRVEESASAPGKQQVIHFNNAGAGLMPEAVLQTQIEYLQLEARIGGYEAARLKASEIESVYHSVSTLLNCHSDEVAIVENATVGWMMLFYAIPFVAGDRILTTEAEYASNYLAYLQLAKQKSVVVEVVPSNEAGEICLHALESMIDARVKLISISHIPTNGGLVNPALEVGRIARKYNVLYLLDACQSAGQLPLDVKEIQCDFLTATSRKYLRGPRGCGFLFISRSRIADLHPPMIDLYSAECVGLNDYRLREDARRFENWENNYSARLGMGRAIDHALSIGIARIEQQVGGLAEQLRTSLNTVDGVFVQDIGHKRCGIVSFSVEGMDATDIMYRLNTQGVNVSVSKPSSTPLDAARRNLPDLVRASVHYYNDQTELDRFIELLEKIIHEH